MKLLSLRGLRRRKAVHHVVFAAMLGWSLLSPYEPAGARYVPDATWNPVWEPEYDADNNEIPQPSMGADTTNSDTDTLPNWLEFCFGTDVYSPDTDGDGATDSDEVFVMGTSPTAWDTNGNGTGDGAEWIAAHSPPVILTPSVIGAFVGTAFSLDLSAWGGSGGYVWGVDGLPPGFALTPAAGGAAITGTPSIAGSWTLTLQVTDSEQQTAGKTVTLDVTIPVPVIVTPSALPVLTTGTMCDLWLGAVNGTPPYSWSIISGGLPAGVGLSTDGHLTGSPSAAGGSSFTMRVSDNNGLSADKDFSITTADPPVFEITTASLPAAESGAGYDVWLGAGGGAPPLSWSVTGGSLPLGLSISPEGRITGTTFAAGTQPVTIQVADGAGRTASRDYFLTVAAQPVFEVGTGSLASVETGSTYGVWLSANGGTPAFSWSIASGGLPAGLTLSADGWLSGSPVSSAGVWHFTVQVADSAGLTALEDLSLEVTGPPPVFPPPVITCGTALSDGAAGEGYSTSITTTGGAPPLVFSLAGGVLPGGLSLSSDGGVGGVPTSTGTWNFTVQVSDAIGQTVVQPLVMTVVDPNTGGGGGGGTTDPDTDGDGLTDSQEAAAGTDPSQIDTDGDYLTDNEEVAVFAGQGFNPLVRCSTENGTPDYFVAGQRGLLVDSDGGGIPDRLEDHWAPMNKSNIEDDAGDLDSDGVSNVAEYNAGYDVLNGFIPAFDFDGDGMTNIWELAHDTRWDVADGDADPDDDWWMNIEEYRNNTDPRALDALPGDDLSLLMHSTNDWDGDGRTNAQEVYSINGEWNPRFKEGPIVIVIQPPVLTITTSSLPSVMTGGVYSAGVTVTGATGSLLWSLSGSLPPGISFGNDGFSGTATSAGSYSFSLSVSDETGSSASRSLSITVTDPPEPLTATTTSLPDAVVNSGYAAGLTASGGTPPYSWSVLSGSLPPGLTLAASGAISGTPQSAEVFNITFRVIDAEGDGAASAPVSLTVAPESTGGTPADPPRVIQPVSLEGRVNALTGGYYPAVAGTPETVEEFLEWVDDEVISDEGAANLDQFNALLDSSNDTVRYLELYSHSRPPFLFSADLVWDWAVQKQIAFIMTRTIPGVPGHPESAADYVAENEIYSGGRLVLETAGHILYSNPARRYPDAVTEHLTFNEIGDEHRAIRQPRSQDMPLTVSATGGAYPQARSAQYWLRAHEDDAPGMSRAFVVKSWTVTAGPNGSIVSNVRTGMATLGYNSLRPFNPFASDHRVSNTATLVSTVPEAPVQYISIADGILTCTPAVPTGPDGDKVTNFASLLPIEVMQPTINADGTVGDFVSVSEIRPGRWIDAFDSAGNYHDWMGRDRDRVKIRIGGDLPGFTFRIGTSGLTGLSDNQGADDLNKWEPQFPLVGNDRELYFVTDSNDDDSVTDWDGHTSSLGNEDDDFDQTHLFAPGGKMKLEISPPGGQKFVIEFPLAKKIATVSLGLHCLSKDGVVDPNYMPTIRRRVDVANEVYRQWSIEVLKSGDVDGVALPDSVNDILDDGVLDDRKPSAGQLSELDRLYNALSAYMGTTTVPVFYVDAIIRTPTGTASGVTAMGTGPCFISLRSHIDSTLPHELGHALGVDHVNGGGVKIPNRLMSDGTQPTHNDFHDAKRFVIDEVNQYIKKSSFYVPSP